MGSIPQPQHHLLSDRDSWETHFKPRLDPDNPARYPADWDERVKIWRDPARTVGAALPGGSVYGWICATGWGWKNISYVVYDDPAWFEEMVETCHRLHHRHADAHPGDGRHVRRVWHVGRHVPTTRAR